MFTPKPWWAEDKSSSFPNIYTRKRKIHPNPREESPENKSNFRAVEGFHSWVCYFFLLCKTRSWDFGTVVFLLIFNLIKLFLMFDFPEQPSSATEQKRLMICSEHSKNTLEFIKVPKDPTQQWSWRMIQNYRFVEETIPWLWVLS